MNACETCRAEFLCERLVTALKIAHASEELKHGDGAKELLRIEQKLKSAGWAFRESERVCAFESNTPALVAITTQLIDLLHHRGCPMPKTMSDASLVHEEYRHE